jgi:hypothetical protein
MRNLGEYEGDLDVNERIVGDLIAACRQLAVKVAELQTPTRPESNS